MTTEGASRDELRNRLSQRSENGALVIWRHGYDLPGPITRETPFYVEARLWQSNRRAIMGYMTEVYVLAKPVAD